jgi:hypothetical protein
MVLVRKRYMSVNGHIIAMMLPLIICKQRRNGVSPQPERNTMHNGTQNRPHATQAIYRRPLSVASNPRMISRHLAHSSSMLRGGTHSACGVTESYSYVQKTLDRRSSARRNACCSSE